MHWLDHERFVLKDHRVDLERDQVGWLLAPKAYGAWYMHIATSTTPLAESKGDEEEKVTAEKAAEEQKRRQAEMAEAERLAH